MRFGNQNAPLPKHEKKHEQYLYFNLKKSYGMHLMKIIESMVSISPNVRAKIQTIAYYAVW